MPHERDDEDLLVRSAHNPILVASQWPYRVNAVMNAGAVVHEGQTVLVCRVEDRRGFSHLAVARSDDGTTGWQVDPEPLLEGGDAGAEWGVEDPRVTWVDELDAFVITHTIYGPTGARVALSRTTDFRSAERIAVVGSSDDKNAVLFPRRIGGRFVMFTRPARADEKPSVWAQYSDDLQTWEQGDRVMAPREGNWWDSLRIGAGAPPLETEHGWLMFYHGVRRAVSGDLYRAGAVLLDLDDPTVVTHRCEEWLLSAQEPYEVTGDVPGVVFPCGLTVHGDELRLYYGAADTCLGVAHGRLSAVVDRLLASPAR
ncbi:glycosidase [Luteococcus sediminum]